MDDGNRGGYYQVNTWNNSDHRIKTEKGMYKSFASDIFDEDNHEGNQKNQSCCQI